DFTTLEEEKLASVIPDQGELNYRSGLLRLVHSKAMEMSPENRRDIFLQILTGTNAEAYEAVNFLRSSPEGHLGTPKNESAPACSHPPRESTVDETHTHVDEVVELQDHEIESDHEPSSIANDPTFPVAPTRSPHMETAADRSWSLANNFRAR